MPSWALRLFSTFPWLGFWRVTVTLGNKGLWVLLQGAACSGCPPPVSQHVTPKPTGDHAGEWGAPKPGCLLLSRARRDKGQGAAGGTGAGGAPWLRGQPAVLGQGSALGSRDNAGTSRARPALAATHLHRAWQGRKVQGNGEKKLKPQFCNACFIQSKDLFTEEIPTYPEFY